MKKILILLVSNLLFSVNTYASVKCTMRVEELVGVYNKILLEQKEVTFSNYTIEEITKSKSAFYGVSSNVKIGNFLFVPGIGKQLDENILKYVGVDIRLVDANDALIASSSSNSNNYGNGRILEASLYAKVDSKRLQASAECTNN